MEAAYKAARASSIFAVHFSAVRYWFAFHPKAYQPTV
jgi:hypothetical protein